MKTYQQLIPLAREAAKQCGYALAVHGSELRDLDLVAIPWIDEATSREVLVESIRMAVEGVIEYGREGRDPTVKPHGRAAYSIHLGKSQYIDLSVMPLRRENTIANAITGQTEETK